MYDSDLSSYLTGLSLMASSMVKNPCYVIVEAFKKDENKIKQLKKCEDSLRDILETWFNWNKEIIENFWYLIEAKVGDPVNVYELPDKELKKIEKESPFFILEEAYIVEYDRYLLKFMIGNNE